MTVTASLVLCRVMIAALVSSAVLLRNEMPAGHIPLASAPLLRGLHRFLGTVWESLVFQFGERANYEAHFGSVGSRYLLHFYNVLYRVCPGAQQLSQTDKNRALQLLESTRKDVLDATKGLSDAQVEFQDRSGPLVGCSNKVQAPEALKPTNRFGSPQGSIDHFVESRAKTEDFLKTTPGLQDHAVESPAGGKWDAQLMVAAAKKKMRN